MVKTDCVLENKRVKLDFNTPINNYAKVWYDNKKAGMLIDTGTYVDVRNREHTAILARHPYELAMIDYSEMLSSITENGFYFIQVITDIIEPLPLTYKDLLVHLTSLKEVDLTRQVKFRDIISEKIFTLQKSSGLTINIMEVNNADT